MRIAIMGPWNDCCGIAVHARLVGQALLDMGHELVVFASRRERPVGRIPVDVEDEPFVRRNWDMYRYGDRIEDDAPLDLFFDPAPMLEEDYEVLIVEKPCTTPLSKLVPIFGELKAKARVLAVMHEGRVPANRNLYRLRWDVATVFDGRFMELYGHLLNAGRVEVVPYPCHPVVEGDRKSARDALGLPDDGAIVMAFGLRARALWPIMPVLDGLAGRYDIRLLILVEHERFMPDALSLRARYGFVMIRRGAPDFEGLYAYLHASDALLLHRPPADYVPVSSTVQLCLGALRPILCPDNNFFEIYGDAVLRYSGPDELEEKLKAVLEGDGLEELIERAREFVLERDPISIAERLLSLALDQGG